MIAWFLPGTTTYLLQLFFLSGRNAHLCSVLCKAHGHHLANAGTTTSDKDWEVDLVSLCMYVEDWC